MRILAILLAGAIALAGCSGSDGGETSTTTTAGGTTSAATTTTGSTGTSTGTTTTSGSGSNAAPTASLTADVTSGAAPLEVTFTIDGDDADGDTLAWSLDADGDGSTDADGTGDELPIEIAFTYETAGTFTATLEVADRAKSATATVEITISGEGGWTGPAPLVYEGTTSAVDPLYFVGEGCWVTYQEAGAPTGAGYDMEGDRGGWSYVLDPATDYEAIFYDSENIAQTGSGTSGSVPEGSYYVDVCGAGPGALDGSYTLTVYPPGHPDAPA